MYRSVILADPTSSRSSLYHSLMSATSLSKSSTLVGSARRCLIVGKIKPVPPARSGRSSSLGRMPSTTTSQGRALSARSSIVENENENENEKSCSSIDEVSGRGPSRSWPVICPSSSSSPPCPCPIRSHRSRVHPCHSVFPGPPRLGTRRRQAPLLRALLLLLLLSLLLLPLLLLSSAPSSSLTTGPHLCPSSREYRHRHRHSCS